MMLLSIILILLMIFAGLWAVLTRSLLYAAIGLALTSVMVATIMFLMGAPLAGVFELSVGAGLITVVFITVISLTRPLTREAEAEEERKGKKINLLLTILLALSLILALVLVPYQNDFVVVPHFRDATQFIWQFRRYDILGQIVAILAGALGVVVLFKNWEKERGTK